MVASTVIRELSRCLQGRFEQGLRAAGEEAGADDTDAGESPRRISVYLVHPRDLEGVSELPVASLYLWDVAPEPRLGSRGSTVESSVDTTSVDTRGQGDTLRRAPAWVVCRYALAIRGRRLEDEHVLVAAGIRELHDRSTVSVADLPSLLSEPTLKEGSRFPITVKARPDLWRTLGLDRHRLLIGLEVPVPIPSTRREAALRVLERRLDIAVDPPEDMIVPQEGSEA